MKPNCNRLISITKFINDVRPFKIHKELITDYKGLNSMISCMPHLVSVIPTNLT